MIDALNANFHAGSHFFPLGPPRQGEWFFSAVTGWLVDLGKKWPKRAANLKKNRGDQLKTGGASERGSILWHWALLSGGECQTHMITLIFLAVTGWNLLLIDLEERRWPKRAADLEKMRGFHLKTKGGASQGKRIHLVTLGPPRQGEGQTHIIKLFFSSSEWQVATSC